MGSAVQRLTMGARLWKHERKGCAVEGYFRHSPVWEHEGFGNRKMARQLMWVQLKQREGGEMCLAFPKGSKGSAAGLVVPVSRWVVPGTLPHVRVWKMPLRWPSCSQSFHPALPVSVLAHPGQCVHESSPQWLLLQLLLHLQFHRLQECAGQDCERLFLLWPRQLQRRNGQTDRSLSIELQPRGNNALWCAGGTCGSLLCAPAQLECSRAPANATAQKKLPRWKNHGKGNWGPSPSFRISPLFFHQWSKSGVPLRS